MGVLGHFATSVAIDAFSPIHIATSAFAVVAFFGFIAKTAFCDMSVAVLLRQKRLTAFRTTPGHSSHHLSKILNHII